MSDLRTITYARLRVLRDIAGQLGSRDLADALTELIHLRTARADGELGVNRRVEPEDLRK